MFLRSVFQLLDPTSLESVLLWVLAGPGVVVVVSKGLSLLAELWPKWATLPTFVKTFVPIVFAALLGVAAQLLLAQPELIAAIDPWYKVVAIAVLAWVASQQQYQASKRAEFGARFN